MSQITPQPVQPEQVDTLIHAGWVITGDDEKPLADYCLAIRGSNIADLCPSADAEHRYTASKVLHLKHHALLPGLVNSHGHCPMTLLRGYADDLPLQPWLEQKIWPAESRWVSEEFVRDGAELAVAEMLLAGITSFSDMYFFPEIVAQVAEQAHIRVQLTCPILDFPTVWAQNADEYIRKTTVLHDEVRKSRLVSTAFGPHAPYTVSDEPLRKIAMLSAELDMPVHIHAHENQHEVDDSLDKYNKRPLQRLHDLGLLTPSLQAVHMTAITEEDIKLLADNHVSIVHCPSSNMKLGSGICPVSKLLQAGINVCLGTDGAASNNNLDLLEELHLASLLAKVHSGDASTLPAATGLYMATQAGADCLGTGQQTGSLTAGKQADVVAINLDHPNTVPGYDPLSTIVYSAQSMQVDHVWIAGKSVVRDRELLTLDLDEVLYRSRQWQQRIITGDNP